MKLLIYTNNYLNRFFQSVKKTLYDLKKRFSDNIYSIVFINSLIIILEFVYLKLRYQYINSQIPFWYTKMWGDYQLASKERLFFIPIISLVVFVVGVLLLIPIKRYYIRHGMTFIQIFTFSINFLLGVSLVRIIFLASSPFPHLITPDYFDLVVTGIIAFISLNIVIPRFIKFAFEKDIVTNPNLHSHPGMLLSQPSARGGGFLYGIFFIILALIFIGVPKGFSIFYLSIFLVSVLGIVDDYQNTHPESKLHFLENPFVRLMLLILFVSITATLSTKIFFVTNPLGGILSFNSSFVSSLFTTIWIVWVLNVLSWSNGIDGQYAGIIGIASVLIIFLALRFSPIQTIHKDVAVLGAISAGLSFAFIRYTWHPSKILWGFGAMSAGLVLSILSILINSKIVTSILIILIPFLDALVTVIRRILQKKNPLKGDRGHLHHILLNRGWGIGKIAIFYWITTALFGVIGYLTAEKYTIQAGLIIIGLVAFLIAILNLNLINNEKNHQGS